MLLDLHTHLPAPKPEAIISVEPDDFRADIPDQLWSVGYHPWNLPPAGLSQAHIDRLIEIASLPLVVAIGEAGIDKAHPGAAPLFAQINTFRKHVEISESLGKPLIVHCVKAHDIIIAIHKELKPMQQWIIHGFRGKPSIAELFIRQGIGLSFGEHFSAEAIGIVPANLLYAETDESTLPIEQIIDNLHSLRPDITSESISANIHRLCHL